MKKTKENLFLHPVRLRILLAVAGRHVTAQQLAFELKDVPQATLYRNINTLAGAGMLQVVHERRVHNTLEKTYALPEEGVLLSPEDLQNAGPEDYLRLVTQYFGLLLNYSVKYFQQSGIDPPRDNALFQIVPLYLSHAEALALGQGFNGLLQPYLKNEPSPERRRLILGLTSIPDVVSSPGKEDSDDE